MDFLCLAVFPHIEAITAWFKTNGFLGNAIYLGLLAAVIFVNRKAEQTIELTDKGDAPLWFSRKGTKEQAAKRADGMDITISVKAPIGPLLIVPSMVMYIYKRADRYRSQAYVPADPQSGHSPRKFYLKNLMYSSPDLYLAPAGGRFILPCRWSCDILM